MSKIQKSDDEWRKQLSDEEFHVARKKGTERAFTGRFFDCHDKGTYKCVCCGAALFSSEHKYDSGSGWPSFYQTVENAPVGEVEDNSYGMRRVEVVCSECGAHLGHLFPDGPKPTHMRYCINSLSLKLEKAD